ncbi:MAG: hypothetical protein ABSG46_20685, partial [Candidatus Binataceae bacterium]
ITEGDNDDGGIPGYSAGPGSDQGPGWGSPNIALRVAAFPGVALSAQATSVKVARGANAQAGTFSITNTTTDPIQLIGITLDIKSPNLFSVIRVSATANDITQNASAAPSKHTSLTFPSPLVILSSQAAQVTLNVSAGYKIGSSSLAAPSGSVSISDGQGGIIVVTGLPSALATVKVQ